MSAFPGRLAGHGIVPGRSLSKDMLQQVFAQGADWDGPMPGKSSRECGNYVNLDAALARQCCAFYAGVIRDWTAEQLVYPE